MNSLPPLSLLDKSNLASETLKKLTSLIEQGCEFYKISEQKRIHEEINTQIKNEKEMREEAKINEETLENTENLASAEENGLLKQLNTMQAVDEVSSNLQKMINEMEKKEGSTEFKKKIVQQAKNKLETPIVKKEQKIETNTKQKNYNVKNEPRLNKILQIPTKKPEVDSIIKLYLSKSGEFNKEEGNLGKTQKMLEEDIKKTKKNIQELAHKSSRMIWQEEREVLMRNY